MLTSISWRLILLSTLAWLKGQGSTSAEQPCMNLSTVLAIPHCPGCPQENVDERTTETELYFEVLAYSEYVPRDVYVLERGGYCSTGSSDTCPIKSNPLQGSEKEDDMPEGPLETDQSGRFFRPRPAWLCLYHYSSWIDGHFPTGFQRSNNLIIGVSGYLKTHKSAPGL